MDRIEHRFLIYEQFKKDAPFIFSEFCDKFNFKIIDCTIYGIHFANNRCEFDLTSESGNLQLWLKIPKYNIMEMIPKLCKIKGEFVSKKYLDIVREKKSREMMVSLCNFLIAHFSEEFNEEASA